MDINEYKKKIGLNIKSLRVKKSYKQKDLADFIQISRASIGYIERGEQNFTIETLYKIANVLNVSIKDLLDVD